MSVLMHWIRYWRRKKENCKKRKRKDQYEGGKSTPEMSAALDGMEEGWNQSLNRLAEHMG